MKTALELRADRAKDFEIAKAIIDKAEAENRNLSAEEKVEYDRIHAAMEEKRERYERIERQDTIDRELSESRGRVVIDNGKPVSGEEKAEKAEKRTAAFEKWVRRGDSALTAEDKQVLYESRALSAATNTAGEYTIPEGFVKDIEISMTTFGGMREVARIIKTADGAALPWPTMNDAGNAGAILAENTQVTNQDVAFSVINFGAYKYSSKQVLVPVELLQDTGVPLSDILASALGERLARITNTHFTTGDNASKPQGVVTGASSGVTAAATAAITADDLVELQHSVDPAYRRNGTFMFADATLKAIKKLKDADNRYLWSAGLAVKEPDTILGHKYVVNQDVATMAANAKSVLFGDFSKYVIRDVLGLTMLQLRERYADYHQVAFLAFLRTDGRVLDAGTDPIKFITQAAV